MNFSRWLLVIFILPFGSFANEPGLPNEFTDPSLFYRLVSSSVLDIDAALISAGIHVHSCQLQNGPKVVSHRGVGACLYESLNYTFKEKKPSVVFLWVLNSTGQYLPPLRIEWKNTHPSWFNFGKEFVALSFESFFGHMIKKGSREVSTPGQPECGMAAIPDRDLGNFIGDISIQFPKHARVSDYFKFSALDWTGAETIRVSSKTPFFLNKKRTYSIKAQIENERAETIQVSFLTNYNLVRSRTNCISGQLLIEKTKPSGLLR